jgi:hypothetical protein
MLSFFGLSTDDYDYILDDNVRVLLDLEKHEKSVKTITNAIKNKIKELSIPGFRSDDIKKQIQEKILILKKELKNIENGEKRSIKTTTSGSTFADAGKKKKNHKSTRKSRRKKSRKRKSKKR